jgi:hypothetical protein
MIIGQDDQEIRLRGMQSSAESEEGKEEAFHRFKAYR